MRWDIIFEIMLKASGTYEIMIIMSFAFLKHMPGVDPCYILC